MVLTPEELALGQEMIKSKKARRDIMDAGWNRFMFDDKDSDLPEWFVKEEEFHMRKHPDVDPEVVEFYKNRYILLIHFFWGVFSSRESQLEGDTGCPGSNWQIAGGYFRLKTWIDI